MCGEKFSSEELKLARYQCEYIIKNAHPDKIGTTELKDLLSEIKSGEVSLNNDQVISLFIKAQRLLRDDSGIVGLDDVRDYPKEKLGR